MLIHTKLNRPQLRTDALRRQRLLDRLNSGLDRKLILISAQAGAGKTTLLAQWLADRPHPSAWLSLDEHDNELSVFVSYLCVALQGAMSKLCDQTLQSLRGPATPPPRFLLASLINELNERFGDHNGANDRDDEAGFILALDDYHAVDNPTIHQFVADLIAYLPPNLHLALASRSDPPIPLAMFRAKNELTELRTADLRFTPEEASVLLQTTAGCKLDDRTIKLLANKTEGWAVGLHLAALSLQQLPDDHRFGENFQGTTSSAIVDYLVSEVLTRLSPEQQNFLLRTSIVDRFNIELCDTLLRQEETNDPDPSRPGVSSAHTILLELRAANLFVLPLDPEERWFRYHHMFRDLLRYRMARQSDPDEIVALHGRASRWFEEQGLMVEALNHAFAAGKIEQAMHVVTHHRFALMNQARWHDLALLLQRFPADYVDRQPELLMLRTWLLYHQGHDGQIPTALKQVESALADAELSPKVVRGLEGEINALRSMIYYYRTDVDGTIQTARRAIHNTPDELWIVRILARLFLAGATLMQGDVRGAYDVIFRALDQESVQGNAFKSTLLMSACYLDWVTADLERLVETATRCLALCDDPYAGEIEGYARYHLASAYYQRNELTKAEEQFSAVVQHPYLNYGMAFVDSAFGLSLTYQARGRTIEARNVATDAVSFLLETGNRTLLEEARAFQAELAWRQGRMAEAEQWLAQFDVLPPMAPMTRLYRSQFTPVKIWLSRNEPGSRRLAAERLGQMKEYTAHTRNTVASIEGLALQALLYALEGDETTALVVLEQALACAQPGRFERIFVDLGPPMSRLLRLVTNDTISTAYVDQILAAFPIPPVDHRGQIPHFPVEPLTRREVEVLSLLVRRMTNKEIADALFVSPDTVKSHTLSIYAKLDVHGRRQAVARAQELGLLLPN